MIDVLYRGHKGRELTFNLSVQKSSSEILYQKRTC